MAIFWILRVFFHTLSTKTSHKMTFKLIGNVRIALVDKLSRLPLGTVQGMPSGALKNIICERTDSMEPTLAHVVPEFTANLCAPIMLFIYILTIDWRIALLSLATLPVAVIAMVWMFKDSSIRFQKTQDTTKELNDTAVEYIGGIEVIKAFGKVQSSYQRFADAAQKNSNSFIDWMYDCIVPFSLGMVITPATLLAVLPIGAIFTMHGSLSLPDFIMTVILSCGLITPLITVMSYNDDVTKATSIFKEISNILELPELERPGTSVSLPENHGITLQNVHFGYGDKEILHGIDLNIPDGSVLALVGPSGSGKSTVAKLLTGLHTATGGRILLDGADITHAAGKARRALYTRVQMVFQDAPGSFNPRRTVGAMIGETICRLCAPDGRRTEERVAALLYEVGLPASYARRYPHEMSGGECQRAAIARAMAVHPDILLCDEATSALDVSVQAKIVSLLLHLQKEHGMSLIFISHDLPLVSSIASRVLIMRAGRIVEEGTASDVLVSPANDYTKKLLCAAL